MFKIIYNLSKDIQFTILIYKILYDTLFYLIVAMLLCLVVEGAIPGMVSGNNGFIILSFLIFANIFSISHLGRKLSISFKKNSRHHIMPFALFFSFILIGNSLLSFSFWENLIITTSVIIILVLFYQMLMSNENQN